VLRVRLEKLIFGVIHKKVVPIPIVERPPTRRLRRAAMALSAQRKSRKIKARL
jgi:hypothetical protein